jgi:hypothetical protein
MKKFIALMHLVSGSAAISIVLLAARQLNTQHRKSRVAATWLHIISSSFALIVSIIQTQRILEDLRKR